MSHQAELSDFEKASGTDPIKRRGESAELFSQLIFKYHVPNEINAEPVNHFDDMKGSQMEREKMRAIVESRSFQLFIAGVICFNAISIGFETMIPAGETRITLEAIDLICLAIYIIEAAMKLYVYHGDYFKEGWNVFDFGIIVVSLIVLALSAISNTIAIPIQIVRTLRLFRVIRVFKIVSLASKLRLIVETIGKSIPSVLWTCLLLFIVMYVFDVAGVFIFGEEFPVYFGDLAAGLLTLFQVLTLEGWPEIARPIIEIYPFAWLYFVPFIVLTAFIMLNIILAIIIDTVEEARQANRIEPGATNIQLAAELEELEAQINTVQHLLDKMNDEKRSAPKEETDNETESNPREEAEN